LVLTSAHVVAGATTIEVVRDSQSVQGRIVGFDPNMDLAYVAVEGISGLPFSVSSGGVEAGAEGVAYVVRDGIVVELPVTVSRRITIRTEDVYSQGDTLRPGFELDGDVQLGDSGGAVVIDGKLVGVVWARSRQTEERSWAIDPDRAGELIDEQLSTGTIDAGIDLTRCR
jgi:S1-C subfamily serine protease